ncbi:hypothetical protein KZ483_17890 [Paenibacillus sp. sptzw28]|uniref:DUF6115 domain-containing protein n=1 Tax=Paenibacillus sp. sptzw28 TaxID=715179 RepID=UPI001C6EA3B0|nr:hypothetical protein [Paenibacillus sp. sptzw28]QYR19746.1 hypothetical protein KZ483_17890 [Paenibacillus sp. sptzw28]
MEPWQIIVLLGALAVIGSVLLPRKNVNTDQSQTVRNMETALEQFMENMEADNRELARLVTKAQQEASEQALERERRIAELEKQCAKLEASLAERLQGASQYVPAAASVTYNLNQHLAESQNTDSIQDPSDQLSMEREELPSDTSPTIRRRYAELFAFHDNGKSVEAIARKLNMNKGEVLLILQLSKQEEAVRHE